MERLLSIKVELWAVLLIVILGVIACLGFGFAVLDGARDKPRFGDVSQAAYFLASMPDAVKQALEADHRMEIYDSARYTDLPGGWSSVSGGSLPQPGGYLLLSRFDGDARRPAVELLSLSDWTVKHRWQPEADSLLAAYTGERKFSEQTNWDSAHFRAIHPDLLADGSLIIKDHNAPLMRIDACARPMWLMQERLFHHSSERDADGNFWVPSVITPPQVPRVAADFFEDAIVQVSPEGKVLFEKSVPQMLTAVGKDHLMFSEGRYDFDPTHLNDIQPVLEDGPYWKRGDVFLSLRNVSIVLLYRPSTDEVIWMQDGPWLSQHDVDILDDHRISVYDNQARDGGGAVAEVLKHSRIMVHDFATDTDSEMLADTMAGEKIQTLAAGLFTAIPGGWSLVEDVTNARLVLAGADGKPAARFINRAADGKIYQLGWSRYLSQSEGDAALSAMGATTCNG